MRLVFLFLNPLPVLRKYSLCPHNTHPEFSTSPIPLAEMISSDHSTAEISHFLNKWCLSLKLFTTMELNIKKVEID